MMATVLHVTCGLGLRKFQARGFLFDRMYIAGFVSFLCQALVKSVVCNSAVSKPTDHIHTHMNAVNRFF